MSLPNAEEVAAVWQAACEAQRKADRAYFDKFGALTGPLVPMPAELKL